jgi:hypothetical protein
VVDGKPNLKVSAGRPHEDWVGLTPAADRMLTPVTGCSLFRRVP